MHQYSASFAILSLYCVLITQARLASYTPATHVTSDSLTYSCPDTTEKTIPFKGKFLEDTDNDVVVYVKPALTYPFRPIDISLYNHRMVATILLCAGMCSVWAYVMYLAALKTQN